MEDEQVVQEQRIEDGPQGKQVLEKWTTCEDGEGPQEHGEAGP